MWRMGRGDVEEKELKELREMKELRERRWLWLVAVGLAVLAA